MQGALMALMDSVYLLLLAREVCRLCCEVHLASPSPLKREYEANLNHTTFELDPKLLHLATIGKLSHHACHDIPKCLIEGTSS
jgi:hypothetical protein